MTRFLRQSAGRAFQLGSFDCGLWLADWCAAARGVDPAAALRGRYLTLEEALRLTRTASLPRMFDHLLRGVGIQRTRWPLFGDIAAISIASGSPRGAIVTGGFVIIGEAGLSRIPFAAARRICAWSIHA